MLYNRFDNRLYRVNGALDLSAAFDTVDHQILLCVLSDRFGISDTALNWFYSCLSERTQSFIYAGDATDCLPVTCSVPQGSVLGTLVSLHTPRILQLCLKSMVGDANRKSYNDLFTVTLLMTLCDRWRLFQQLLYANPSKANIWTTQPTKLITTIESHARVDRESIADSTLALDAKKLFEGIRGHVKFCFVNKYTWNCLWKGASLWPPYVIGQAIYIFFLWFLYGPLVCDITIFVLKRDVKLQLTNVSMVALCNRADHYIFALWFLSFFFLSSFFPRLISAVGDWMYTILPHMMWP